MTVRMPGVRLEFGSGDSFDSALEWRDGAWMTTGSASWLLGDELSGASPHVAVLPSESGPHMVSPADGQIYLYAVFTVGLGSYTSMRLLDADGEVVSRAEIVDTVNALGRELTGGRGTSL